jgi:tRNA threonylcarbamoyl adenosine modification protein (Sua5/YciO/YrdC/YwlC family)
MADAPCLQISADQPDAVPQALAALAAGRLVGLPTETVYGIGALLNSPLAIKQLKAAAEISDSPAWVLHLADPDDLKGYIAEIPPLAERLVNKLWPGPLAIRLRPGAGDLERLQERIGKDMAGEALDNGWLTFRCPQHALTQEIIRRAGSPMVIVGANRLRPIASAQEIPQHVVNQLAVLIDGGPTRYSKPSTLIQVGDQGIQIIREGAVAERTIRRLADFVILFVCTGNTCRSPMAAGLAAVMLAQKLGISPDELNRRHIMVESAGLAAMHGLSATPEAIGAAGELGADITKHRSRSVTEDLLRRAAVIYTMTKAHRAGVLAHLPAAGDKTQVLDPEGDIADPIGGDIERYRAVAERLKNVLRQRIAEVRL